MKFVTDNTKLSTREIILDAIKQAGVGTAGSDVGEVRYKHLEGLAHALVRILSNFIDHC